MQHIFAVQCLNEISFYMSWLLLHDFRQWTLWGMNFPFVAFPVCYPLLDPNLILNKKSI